MREDRSIRVLIVEDRSDDAELLVRALKHDGYSVAYERVDTADSLDAALEQRWDVILSDYSMPGFDGLRALRMVRDRGLDTPFIMVSGTVGEEVAVQAMREGIQDYLLKDNLVRLPVAVAREIRESAGREKQKQLQKALAAEERRFRTIFESAAVSLLEVDLSDVKLWLDEQGLDRADNLSSPSMNRADVLVDAAARAKVIAVNERTATLLGAEKKQLLGPLDHLLPRGFTEIWCETLVAILSGSSMVQLETAVTTFDCREVHVLVSVKLPGSLSELDNVIFTMLDISERVKLEHQMQAAQRMEAVGRLAGGVAHDFNNILTIIQSYAGFLRASVPEESRGDADIILDVTKRASKLTNQLLAFSRKQVQRLEVIDLNEAISAMGAMLPRLIGEDIALNTKLSENVHPVRADPTQIEQIVMNLAVNARDAMPNGGRLTIETLNADLDGEYPVHREVKMPPGRYVMLAVNDSGLGMDAETQRHIFEPFFSTKSRDRGTGLGLSTVYGIVKQSGGFIWVYSEPGRGTVFKIYLPAVDAEPARTASATFRVHSLAGTETVLLVEDDDLVRVAARRILERSGYNVIEASHGLEAIPLAKQYDHRIHIVLTDVVMPELNGPDMAQELTRQHPDLRVVYMSGYTDDAIAHHGILESGTAFLEKPFTPESLLRTVREALDRA